MTKYSYYLLFLIITFVLFGFMMVYSASSFQTVSDSIPYSSFAIAKKQLIYITIGIIFGVGASFVDYKKYEKYTYVFYVVTVVLLIALLIFGREVNGAVRWINLKFVNFQPSEFAKIAIIIYLAHSLSKKNINFIKQFYIGVLPHLVFTGIIILLILRQPDFGTSAIIGMVLFIMMIVAGVKWRDIIMIFAVLISSAYLLVITAPYRVERFKAFLNPWEHRQTSGYQLIESLFAFGSGKVSGVGLGNSFQKRFYLPEAHTDFIGAIIGEELGLIGTISLIILFVLFFYVGIRIAQKAQTLFGVYVALGISILIFVQTVVNFAVILGALPTKGLTLPFISFGGSSIVSTLIMMGILFNISKQQSENELPLVNYVTDNEDTRKKTNPKKVIKQDVPSKIIHKV